MAGRITSVTLRRGDAFSPFPENAVTLRRASPSTRQGGVLVGPTGARSIHLDADEFDRLAAFIERSGFFQWKEHYEWVAGFDGATDVIEVWRAGTVKTVSQHETDEPADFWVIAQLVEGLAAKVALVPPQAAGGIDADPTR